MKKQYLMVEEKPSLPFWRVTVVTGLIAIIWHAITGNNSLGELLILILLVLALAKLFVFGLRLGSITLRVLIVSLVVLAWIGTFFH